LADSGPADFLRAAALFLNDDWILGPLSISADFFAFAREASASARAAGVSSLICDYLHMDLSDDEALEVESILAVLLDDPSPLVRRAMAEGLAHEADAPRHIILALASDQPEIAALVLQYAPHFSDAELAEMALITSVGPQLAMARRVPVATSICAALTEAGAPCVLIELARNEKAQLSQAIMLRMLERAGEEGRLRDAAVKSIGGESLSDQVVGKLVHHPLGLAKNDAEFVAMEIDEAEERLEFHALGHFVIPLLNRGNGELLLLDFDGFRLVRVTLDQVADRLGDSRREENGLSLIGRCGEDFFDVLAEAHVEHAIGLVENDHLDRAKLQGAALHVVHDAARSSNNDLDAFFEFEKLAFVGSAAVNRNGMHAAFVCGEFVNLIGDLSG
jgi:hypothetical protein